jgi:hypothetical protein
MTVAHRGVAVEHPANAVVIAQMTRPVVIDRPRLIARLEALQAKHPQPAIARSLERLRNNIPDPPKPPSQAPEEVDPMQLGTHPDIIERLWKIGRALPTNCAWVAWRQPVLAHSVTGVIFGLGIGTLGYALRLPAAAGAEAEAAGSKRERRYRGSEGEAVLSLTEYGADWWFGTWRDEEDRRWTRAAYDYFGAMPLG